MFGRPVPKEIIEKRGEPVRYWAQGPSSIPAPNTPSTFFLTGKAANAPRAWPRSRFWIG